MLTTLREIEDLLGDDDPLPIQEREIAEAAEADRDWACVPVEIGSTKEQRLRLYRQAMPKRLVAAIDREQAADLLALLVRFRKAGVNW